MAQIKSYKNFNNSAFEGRVSNVSIVQGEYGEFAEVTVITNLANDDGGVSIVFNNSNGILSLAKAGHLCKGRMVHVTGHISGISEVYTDKSTGALTVRKRPQVTLDTLSVRLELGALPKSATSERPANTIVVKRVAQDPTPSFGEATAVDELGIPVL